MSVTPADFCSDAFEFLHSDPTSEIKFRNSISRAYYGVYHSALSYADKVSLPPVSAMAGHVHEKLRAFYVNDYSADKEVKLKRRQVGYMLKQLVGGRRKADYDLDHTILQIDADSHYQLCVKCIGIVNHLESLASAAQAGAVSS